MPRISIDDRFAFNRPFDRPNPGRVAPPPVERQSFPDTSKGLYQTNVRGLIAYKADPERFLLFQFNPAPLRDSKSVSYADRGKTGFDADDPIWISGGPRSISFELFLDATEGSRQKHLGRTGGETLSKSEYVTHDPSRGTMKQVEFLQSLQRPLVPKENLPRFVRNSVIPAEQFSAPPEIIFVYGYLYFEGVVSELSIEHKLFNRSLIPIRSEANVTIRIIESYEIRISEAASDLARQGVSANNITLI